MSFHSVGAELILLQFGSLHEILDGKPGQVTF